MAIFEIISLVVTVITKLYPIAKEVYDAINDPEQPEAKSENALDMIKDKAAISGLVIGNTEAELVRSAIHLAEAKTSRHKNYKES